MTKLAHADVVAEIRRRAAAGTLPQGGYSAPFVTEDSPDGPGMKMVLFQRVPSEPFGIIGQATTWEAALDDAATWWAAERTKQQ